MTLRTCMGAVDTRRIRALAGNRTPFIQPLGSHFTELATSLYSCFLQWLLQSIQGPGLFFSFIILFTQTVGLLGRVIS
jgi:hypothetical protein